MDGGDAKDPSPRPAAASIVKVVKVTGVSVEMGSNTLTTDTAGGVDGTCWQGGCYSSMEIPPAHTTFLLYTYILSTCTHIYT